MQKIKNVNLKSVVVGLVKNNVSRETFCRTMFNGKNKSHIPL